MHKNSSFAIMLFGLTDSERRVVKSLCMLSGNRPQSYRVVSPMGADQADVWIVDGKDPAALQSYESARAERGVPAIVVDASTGTDHFAAAVGRPLVASRLLHALDQLVGGASAREATPPAPQVVQAASPAIAASPPPEPAQDPLAPRRPIALVVDDSFTIRKQVEIALSAQGIETRCAETAEAAMKLLATRRFDVIFLDVVLPGNTDGYQICRSIKKSSVHKTTPVVMLTGRSSPFDRVRGSLAGCDTYLTKPVENNTFNAVLKKYIKAPEVALAV